MNVAVIVIGAGGHAAVIAEALLEAGVEVLGFTDPDARLHGSSRIGLPVLGNDGALRQFAGTGVHLANGLGFVSGTGRSSLRARVQRRLQGEGWTFASVQHPRAIVSRHAQLSAGSQVLAGSVVQAGARIGTGTIVNTASVVEHDAFIGNWCHLAPRSTLCGCTRVGDGSLIGAGAVLRQNISVGEDTIVGAGAVLLRDFEGHQTLCGVPARPLGTRS